MGVLDRSLLKAGLTLFKDAKQTSTKANVYMKWYVYKEGKWRCHEYFNG